MSILIWWQAVAAVVAIFGLTAIVVLLKELIDVAKDIQTHASAIRFNQGTTGPKI